jgi:hypothetical protein
MCFEFLGPRPILAIRRIVTPGAASRDSATSTPSVPVPEIVGDPGHTIDLARPAPIVKPLVRPRSRFAEARRRAHPGKPNGSLKSRV